MRLINPRQSPGFGYRHHTLRPSRALNMFPIYHRAAYRLGATVEYTDRAAGFRLILRRNYEAR